ncbi:MAG: hypothetical protein WC829_11405 [Hyphomicrobium sp.]|jgi:hypothetical protein
MAERPSFQFYPADWRGNAKLQRCSIEARGAWIDVLCLLHDADEYGVLRWPLADIAQAVRLPIRLLHELVAKGVLKGADQGATDYAHRPFHAGKHGEPVTLVVADDGPLWYCSRFAKDEWRRLQRGKDTRFTPDNQPPKPAPKSAPTGRVGERQGDGSSVAPALAPTKQEASGTNVPDAAGAETQPKPDPIWGAGLAFLIRQGLEEKPARTFLGKLRKAAGDDIQAAALLAEAEAQSVADPIPWLSKAAANTAARKARPSASDNFQGKLYAGTPDDELPASLR